jgi:uncharacterized protein (TIGR00290 family)
MARKRKKIVLLWSGGKDSALSLFELKSPEWEVVGLLTSFEDDPQKGPVSQMHRISKKLMLAQAEALELPLHAIHLAPRAPNQVYEAALLHKLKELRTQQVDAIASGDARLRDVREYRDGILKMAGLKSVYPLWDWSAAMILQAFRGLNHRAVVHCIEKRKLSLEFLGREFNASFVNELPRDVDPAGENGEFHTFVWDGPFFNKILPVQSVESYELDGFLYQEMNLNQQPQARHN